MQEKINTKILMTGGHAATTAIATIKEIKEKYPDWELIWVGPESAVEGKVVPTLASKVMPKLGVKFIPITTGRLQRQFTIWTIPSLLKIPFGVISAFEIILKNKPEVVVSFGGYASFPICMAAKALNIPVIIHEQTSAAGLANKMVAKFATKIAIARETSKKYFPTTKTVLVGNPVRKEFLKVKPKKQISKTPVIYVTGGSSGAQVINSIIFESLPDLLDKYYVIHQTGKLDFDKAREIKSDNYEVHEFIDEKEIIEVFEKADLIIGRAGANTVSEILISRRPAILIPIPWVQNDEQTKNAKLVEEAGIGLIIKQKDLGKDLLLEKIEFILKNWKKITDSPESQIAKLDKEAANRFVEEISKLLK